MSSTLLLHVCCGPCAIVPIERLREQGYQVTAYFANNNIHPLSEYLRRREAMQNVAELYAVPVIWQDDAWNIEHWLNMVHTKPKSPQRCLYCYASRLQMTAAKSAELGFAYMSSSLLYSRYQQHDAIITSAKHAAAQHNVQFFYQDFRSGWQEGIDISKKLGLYRQPYCGCIYSEAERYSKKLQKLISHAT